MQTSYVLGLNEAGKAPVTLIGGKAASLAALMQGGFNVPPGFVITVYAASYFLDGIGISGEFALWSGDDELATIHRAIMDESIPADLLIAVNSKYDHLVNTASFSGLMAIRSSGAMEDSLESSFAGQYISVLGISSLEELWTGIRKCWRSAFSNDVQRYKQRTRLSVGDGSIGVVVQELVPAEVSGVLFTAHPITGNNDLAVVESSWGMGESIVSGFVVPDHFECEVASKRVTAAIMGSKKSLTYLQGNALVSSGVSDTLRTSFSLTESQVWHLVEIGKQVEDLFGYPVDIEWAMFRDSVLILQARPITSRHPISHT